MFIDLDSITQWALSVVPTFVEWYSGHWIVYTLLLILFRLWVKVHDDAVIAKDKHTRAMKSLDHLIARTGGID